MSLLDSALLVVAAAIGGALNSVAGGGSFLTFPSLVFVGIAPVTANATSTVALWPGAVAAAYAYRAELSETRRFLGVLSAISAVGGLLGALLLLFTPNAVFVRILPFLLLAATCVFTFGKRLTDGFRRVETRSALLGGAMFHFAVSVYGGYFGGGMGILMLAAFSAMGLTNLHVMNALKSLLGALINLVAIGAFVAAGAVAWGPGSVMVVGGMLGGYFGASTARRIPPARVRRFVLAVAWSMTAYFFWKAYGAKPS